MSDINSNLDNVVTKELEKFKKYISDTNEMVAVSYLYDSTLFVFFNLVISNFIYIVLLLPFISTYLVSLSTIINVLILIVLFIILVSILMLDYKISKEDSFFITIVSRSNETYDEISNSIEYKYILPFAFLAFLLFSIFIIYIVYDIIPIISISVYGYCFESVEVNIEDITSNKFLYVSIGSTLISIVKFIIIIILNYYKKNNKEKNKNDTKDTNITIDKDDSNVDNRSSKEI